MKRVLATSALVCVAGFACGKVNPRPAIAEIDGTIRERTGETIEWSADSEELEARRERITPLLAEPLTVETAVRVALLNNREIQARLEEIVIARADLVQAGLVQNPTFGLGILFPHDSEDVSKREFSLSVDLLDFLMLAPRKKLAVSEFEQRQLRVTHEILDFIADVKEAFYTLQAAIQLANRLELILEINQAAAELAGKQFEAGTLNELDMVNQQALYDETRAAVAQAEMEIRFEREEVNRLLGLSGELTKWKAVEELPAIPGEQLSLPDWEQLALEQRLDLAASRLSINIFRRALSLKKKTRFFPFGIEVGVTSEREPEDIHVIGPHLSFGLPIFDVGRASVARLEAQTRQSERVFQHLTTSVMADVRQARDRLVATQTLAEFYRTTLLPQRVRILNLTQRHYNMMLKGTYDLLLAKQGEVAMERSYVETWRDYWLARTALERATEGDLALAASVSGGEAGPKTLSVPEQFFNKETRP